MELVTNFIYLIQIWAKIHLPKYQLPSTVIPHIVPFTFGDEPANPGDSNAINCMINKGDSPLDIKWSLNGQLIVNGENGIGMVRMSPRLSSLSIESINGKHRGVFKCMASNVAGTTEHSTELMVNGAKWVFVLLRKC